MENRFVDLSAQLPAISQSTLQFLQDRSGALEEILVSGRDSVGVKVHHLVANKTDLLEPL
jgi:hypothetical protein